MTKRETERRARLYETLQSLGFTAAEADTMRRMSNTLQNWHSMECGDYRGSIERDEATGKPYYTTAETRRRYPVADRETGALKRLAAIMSTRPHLNTYVQTDPRGAALYILRPDDVPAGKDPAAYYSRGVCVY